jgi:hypothetical protein
MTTDDLVRLLATTSTNAERVRGLLELLTPKMIARATGCSSPSTLRNWSMGQTQPREDAAIAIDDLRIAALTLLEAGLEPERVGRWFASLHPDRFDGLRPFEMIAIDPMEVLAAAQSEAIRAKALRQPPLALVP